MLHFDACLVVRGPAGEGQVAGGPGSGEEAAAGCGDHVTGSVDWFVRSHVPEGEGVS